MKRRKKNDVMDFNTDSILPPWEIEEYNKSKKIKILQDEYLKREKETIKEKEKIAELSEKTTTKKEEKKLKESAEKIKRFYALDYWMRCFNKVSYYNEISGHALFHVLLGQALSALRIYLEDDSEIDWRLHYLWIQDSRCLDENTELIVNKTKIKLKELPEFFLVKCFNFDTKQKETRLAKKINSGKKKVYEIELEDGRKVIASAEHKFFNKEGEIMVKDLTIKESILVDE